MSQQKLNSKNYLKTSERRRQLKNTGVVLASLAFLMLAAAFGAVPLYRIFCQQTGYGGTPQIALSPSLRVVNREITVHFSADVSPELDWEFRPLQTSLRVKIGENAMAFYRVFNRSRQPQKAMAVYNVAPDKAGIYFNKVHCFCFEEQIIPPQQAIDLPVFFFVDADFADDRNLSDVHAITLSYTFFKLPE